MSTEDRKARLKSLRDAAARKERGESKAADDIDTSEPSTLKFRNYIVKDESIKHEKVMLFVLRCSRTRVDVGTSFVFFNLSVNIHNHKLCALQMEPRHVQDEELIDVDVEKIIGTEPADVIANVAPKKPNWDIRREIAGKLAKLERKTQLAIAELAVEEEKKRMGV